MCSHYEIIREKERLERYFGVTFPDDWDPTKDDIWPQYEAPFIRRPREADMDTGDDAVQDREIERGRFGMIPHWAKDDKIGRQTFNARSETVDAKPAFRDAWKNARHCIIPADAFYEPDWRSGKAIPTRISAVDGEPLGIAGLWAWWKQPSDGAEIYSFTMLTINATDHTLMQNFHRPGDEKRMIVILPPERYADWLAAPAAGATEFLQLYPAELLKAEPRPREPKKTDA